MTDERHNLIISEIIDNLNATFERHNCDHAETMFLLESLVTSALASISTHEDCCETVHFLFERVHDRVHDIFETELRKKGMH